MKFTIPAGTNPIDRERVVGQPVDRIDGLLKTTGTTPYAYEQHQAAPNAACGYVIGAAIAKGQIAAISIDAARRAPGVLAVVAYQSAGNTAVGESNVAKLLGGPDVEHYHQTIGLVVAETFEQARAAAALVRADYVKQPGQFDLAATVATAAPSGKPSVIGHFEQAFSSAPVKLDAHYTTPDQSHAMMEPHASIAKWDGYKLTVWTSTQAVARIKKDIVATLGLQAQNVRLISPPCRKQTLLADNRVQIAFPAADGLKKTRRHRQAHHRQMQQRH